MELKELKIIKENDKGKIFDLGNSKLIVRKKNSISADHNHPEKEILYLIDGEVELTVGKETKTIKAPIEINLKQSVYHKILALTDIKLIEVKNS